MVGSELNDFHVNQRLSNLVERSPIMFRVVARVVNDGCHIRAQKQLMENLLVTMLIKCYGSERASRLGMKLDGWPAGKILQVGHFFHQVTKTLGVLSAESEVLDGGEEGTRRRRRDMDVVIPISPTAAVERSPVVPYRQPSEMGRAVL